MDSRVSSTAAAASDGVSIGTDQVLARRLQALRASRRLTRALYDYVLAGVQQSFNPCVVTEYSYVAYFHYKYSTEYTCMILLYKY